ncbi:putative mitochondrial glutathione-S-transferase/glutaredoxin [Leptomonas pyrrhocoris]|uniref:Putative mitochondrial glutathione-S-transferase/glutaredoxin n=1 Tax=Leptomonas pyrrhocoris TaxID=157538 RepID=A0A0M9FWA4_LEPPY|nr:putative mitochondrial glutathione-S-transferase/glutaredoxin [Leptomonas pyrrhocoris]XP_015655825.1 putative mitochondrial glutathione-S-transferase/glutaredoxin [Leptomonas pyrrhocoris]KPA77385.1 putative mitochondrial glutathione-S-transferase/glutaredoxin [Leptomonas pyrrhocoris]KPA77386.1 putative mitochondrial glutathione-S-transferase/glutaredoxin [Leptomonas pyrrhocoris]|eukprot:XP_015655824.1 putative mitochondrial glutathione-S-transferase/glutaredoxin [Leptomonas pyrrhocoris]
MFSKGSLGRKVLLGTALAGVAGLGGGYAMYQRRLKENRSVSAESFNAAQDAAKLKEAFKKLCDTQDHPLTKLYRYTTCPWCGTVKAFLDYHRVPHECVEVEPMFKGELRDSQYKKVPQLRFDTKEGPGPYLVDSQIIVDTLADKMGFAGQLKDDEIAKWRSWARSSLVRFVTLEFNRSLPAAWSGYSYIDSCDTIPYVNKLFLKVIGAPVMYIVAMKVTKTRLVKDGLMKPDDDPKVRLHAEVNRFTSEALMDIKSQKPKAFHGGSKPDLVDLDTYGVLQSVRGHRVYTEMINETKIGPWLTAMDTLLGKA